MLGCPGKSGEHAGPLTEALPKALEALAGSGSEVRQGEMKVAVTGRHRARGLRNHQPLYLAEQVSFNKMC